MPISASEHYQAILAVHEHAAGMAESAVRANEIALEIRNPNISEEESNKLGEESMNLTAKGAEAYEVNQSLAKAANEIRAELEAEFSLKARNI